MSYGDSTFGNSCFCLFDCQCDKVERAIADCTSHEALETVKSRLRNLKDPNEIFARLACMLFYREILDGNAIKCRRDNLKKASIAFSVACSFANEEVDCASFYASCWQRFQQLVSELEQFLGHIRSRRLYPLSFFIEEVFPQDFNVPNGGPPVNPTVHTSPGDRHESRGNQSMLETTSSEIFQVHRQGKNSVTSNNETRIVGSRAPTRSMPSEPAKKRAVERSASEEDEKKPQTRTPMRSTIVDSTPIATNTAVAQQTPFDSEKHKDSQPNKVKIEPTEEVANQSDFLLPISMPSQAAQAQNMKRTEGRNDANGQPPEKRVRFASHNHCSAQQAVCDRKQDKDQSGTSSSRHCFPVITPNPRTNTIDKRNWYDCPKVGCNYKFKLEWMLERHAKNHDMARRFSKTCNECGMDFRKSKDLARHVNLHNNRNRYVCEQCELYYAEYDGLNQHRELFHKFEE